MIHIFRLSTTNHMKVSLKNRVDESADCDSSRRKIPVRSRNVQEQRSIEKYIVEEDPKEDLIKERSQASSAKITTTYYTSSASKHECESTFNFARKLV